MQQQCCVKGFPPTTMLQQGRLAATETFGSWYPAVVESQFSLDAPLLLAVAVREGLDQAAYKTLGV